MKVLLTPPPRPPVVAVFDVNVQLVSEATTVAPLLIKYPPPKLDALFEVNVTRVKVAVEDAYWQMPPPL